MKNNNQPQDTEPKAKMLFNSDGFDLVVKVIVEIFKIFGFILFGLLKILLILCPNDQNSDTERKRKSNELSYIDDEGHGHARNGNLKW